MDSPNTFSPEARRFYEREEFRSSQSELLTEKEQCKRLTSRLAATEADVVNARKQEDSLRSQVTRITKELDLANGTIAHLTTRVRELQTPLDEAKRKVETLTASLNSEVALRTQAEKRISELSVQLHESQAESARLSERLNELLRSKGLPASPVLFPSGRRATPSRGQAVSASMMPVAVSTPPAVSAADPVGSGSDVQPLAVVNEPAEGGVVEAPAGTAVANEQHTIDTPSSQFESEPNTALAGSVADSSTPQQSQLLPAAAASPFSPSIAIRTPQTPGDADARAEQRLAHTQAELQEYVVANGALSMRVAQLEQELGTAVATQRRAEAVALMSPDIVRARVESQMMPLQLEHESALKKSETLQSVADQLRREITTMQGEIMTLQASKNRVVAQLAQERDEAQHSARTVYQVVRELRGKLNEQQRATASAAADAVRWQAAAESANAVHEIEEFKRTIARMQNEMDLLYESANVETQKRLVAEEDLQHLLRELERTEYRSLVQGGRGRSPPKRASAAAFARTPRTPEKLISLGRPSSARGSKGIILDRTFSRV